MNNVDLEAVVAVGPDILQLALAVLAVGPDMVEVAVAVMAVGAWPAFLTR